MPDPRILIYGTYYAATPEKHRLSLMWERCLRTFSPDIDLLLIDSASPVRPQDSVPWVSFDDNIGHLSHHGRDGWGRAFCLGIQEAINRGYDYAVAVEADLLYVGAIKPWVDRMARHQVKIAAPVEPTTWMLETGLVFMDVAWAKERDLIGAYDWQNSSTAEWPEHRLERIAGDELFSLPIKGFRNDLKWLNPVTIHKIDYLTHADMAEYDAFMQFKGVGM